MDLSILKWPIIILVVVGGIWLLSDPGINYLYKKFTSSPIGQDAAVDIKNEAGLSKLASFLLTTFRYQKARHVYQTAVDRYPQGKNVWYNYYQIARCAEKGKDYARASQIFGMLAQNNANGIDSRIPNSRELTLRRQKLVETHQLPG